VSHETNRSAASGNFALPTPCRFSRPPERGYIRRFQKDSKSGISRDKPVLIQMSKNKCRLFTIYHTIGRYSSRQVNNAIYAPKVSFQTHVRPSLAVPAIQTILLCPKLIRTLAEDLKGIAKFLRY
jgi:hypothetical protein